MSFKLLNLQLMIGFPSGPKFIKSKCQELKILMSTVLMKVHISLWSTLLPPNTSEFEPLSFDSDDTTFVIAT